MAQTKDELLSIIEEQAKKIEEIKKAQEERRPKLDESLWMADPNEETVEYILPRSADGKKTPLFVAINGRTFSIPREKRVTIPQYVADFLDSNREENNQIQDRMDAMEEDFERASMR